MVTIALALPALMGVSLIGLLIPSGVPGRIAIVSGAGVIAGILLLPLLLRFLNLVGLGLSFGITAITAGLIATTAMWGRLRQRESCAVDLTCSSDFSDLSPIERLLFILFIALAAWHLVLPTLELLSRPLLAWDTTMHWATKSKAWFYEREMTAFVSPQQWLELNGTKVFTDNNASYPATVPLLQIWMCLAIGRWDESLMNIPWALCLGAFGVAFYGMARAASIRPTSAALFTYLLMSLPLLNIHVALAGYADLFISATFSLAAMAFYLWSVERKYWQALLSVFFAVAGVAIKLEGAMWLAAFLPGLAVILLRWQWSLLVISGGLIMFILMLALLPGGLIIAGQSLDTLFIDYRPEATKQIVASFWSMGNWNLLPYLITVSPVLLLFAGKQTLWRLRGLITVILSVLLIFLFIFTFTGFSAGAVQLTSVWRVALHFIPLILFLLMLLFERFQLSPHGSKSKN